VSVLRNAWPVALLSLKEAVRRKVFLVLIVFGIALVSVFALMPEDPTTRLRVLQMWVMRAMTLFVSIVAIFLAGFSLPGEVERKQIYMLASKPISKVSIILGKYLGYLIVVSMFLLLMGLGGVVIFRATQALQGSENFKLRSLPRYYPATLSGKGQAVDPTTGAFWLRGPQKQKEERLEFHFEGLDRIALEPQVACRLRLSGGTEENIADLSFTVLLRAINPDTLQQSDQILEEVVHNEWFPLEISRDLVGSSGRLIVRIARAADGEYFYLKGADVEKRQAGLVILGAPELFEINFARALALLLLQTVVVLAASVTASSCLSGPVSVLIGVVVLLVGSLSGFLTESLEDVEYTLKNIEDLDRDHGHSHGAAEVPAWMLKASRAVSKVTLAVVPNFSRLNATEQLLDDASIEASQIGNAALAFGLRIVALVALGCGLVLLRDFA
jgi:ABC-type transport system involved in multi-copper enzyme maturation permease subunit